MQTSFTQLLDLTWPIVQAPIGSATTPALAAAVSNAGALGSLSITWRSLDETAAVLAATQRLTSRPFAVNVVLAWPQEARVALALEAGVRIIWTFWGDPAPYVRQAHAGGARVMHSVGSVADAQAALAAGVDVLVAQGVEAGGHVCGSLPGLALLDSLRRAGLDRPIVVAGGMADADDVAATMAAGADGVCLGTRFVCSEEANAAPLYQQLIVGADGDSTVLAQVFDNGWPDAPHRVLRNSTVRMWEAAGRPSAGRRPGEGDVVATTPDGRPIARYFFAIPRPGMEGDLEALALYAGTGVGKIHEVAPAAALVDALTRKLPRPGV